jgi:hydroxyacylglutathione hydrolase
MKVASTIGYELAHNALLAERDEDRFVERVVGALGPQPPNFRAIVAINRGPSTGDPEPPRPLVPRQLDAAAERGALVVDVRTDLQFDEAHVPGAVAITALRAGFGSKLAWLADREQDIVLVGRDDDEALRAARLASAVGIARVVGFLAGGMTSWREERRPVERIARIDVDELHARWKAGDVQVLDVRERAEWDAGHIPGSVFTPYHDLHGIPEAIDPERPVAAVCSSGQRSAVAASLLQRHGAHNVLHVTGGGVGTWERAGRPVER